MVDPIRQIVEQLFLKIFAAVFPADRLRHRLVEDRNILFLDFFAEFIRGCVDFTAERIAQILKCHRQNLHGGLRKKLRRRVQVSAVFRCDDDFASDESRGGAGFRQFLNLVADNGCIDQNENNDEDVKNNHVAERTPVAPVVFFEFKCKVGQPFFQMIVHSAASLFPETPLLSFSR